MATGNVSQCELFLDSEEASQFFVHGGGGGKKHQGALKLSDLCFCNSGSQVRYLPRSDGLPRAGLLPAGCGGTESGRGEGDV